MPCSRYSGKQRRACYATDEWKRPVRKSKPKARTSQSRVRKSQPARKGRRRAS